MMLTPAPGLSAHYRLPLRMSKSQRKKGLPMMAVMMPTGNSAGAMMVRESESANIIMIAPTTVLSGIMATCLVPTI